MKAFCFLLLFIPVSLTAQSFWVADTLIITYNEDNYYSQENVKERRWIYEHNEKGKPTKVICQEMRAEDTILQNKWKRNYFYDEKDSLALITFYDWKDSSFIIKNQLIPIWDKKRTEVLEKRMDDTILYQYEKNIYTYNRKGEFKNVLVFGYRDTLWKKKQKRSYSYFFNKKRVTSRDFLNKGEKKVVCIYTYNRHKLIKKRILKIYTYHNFYYVDDSGNRYRYYRPRSVEKYKTTWKYNNNNLVSIVEGRDNKEIYNYDTNNNVVEKIIQYGNDTLCQKYTYQYDSENNLISTLEQKGKNLEWENLSYIVYKYENNNVVFGESKKWENNQWVDGNGGIRPIYNNGERLFNDSELGPYHQFRGSYKEIKINKE